MLRTRYVGHFAVWDQKASMVIAQMAAMDVPQKTSNAGACYNNYCIYIYICDFIVINNCIVIYVCNVTHTHIHGHLQHVLHMIDTVLGSLLKIMVNIVYWMLLMVEY